MLRRLVKVLLVNLFIYFVHWGTGIQVYAQDPTLARARQLEQNGVFIEAITTYQDYLDKNPNDDDARMALVNLLLKFNRTDEAIAHIKILKKRIPNDQRVVNLYTLVEEYDKSQISYKDSSYAARIRLPNEPPSTMLEYARFLMANEQKERGIAMYKQYLQAKPKDAAVRFELAQHYVWQNRLNESKKELNTIIEYEPQHIDARRLLADIFYWEGDEDRAVENYKIVLQKRPNDNQVRTKLNNIINSPYYQEKSLKETVKREPGGSATYQLAKFYFERGRVYEADSLVSIRLRVAPNDSAAIILASQIRVEKQKLYEKEIAQHKDRLLRNPSDTTAILALARYYSSIPNFDLALKHYDMYLKYYPNDTGIRLERAKVLSWSDNYDQQAIEEFKDILKKQPNNEEARLLLAEAQLARGENLEELLGFFNNRLQINPNDQRIILNYADCQRKMGNYDVARMYYIKVIEVDSSNVRAKEGLQSMEVDFGPLITKLETELKKHPDDKEMRYDLAEYYYKSNRFYEAEEQVKTLLEAESDNIKYQILMLNIRQARESFTTAEINALKDSLTKNPDDFTLRLKLAELYEGFRMFPEAVAQYQYVYEHHPNKVDLAVKMAKLLSYMKDYKEAAKIYQKLAEAYPNDFEYRYRAAEAYAWSGDNENALSQYEKALLINPKSVDCQLAIANLYRWGGNPYAAYDGYKRVISLDPNNKPAQKALKELSEAFLREVDFVGHWLRDSETFRMSEVYFSTIVSFSLRTQMVGGSGRISFEQNDLNRRYLFGEKGWFIHLHLKHQFDSNNKFYALGRFYRYEERSPIAIRLEYEHNFSDVPTLKGLITTIYFTSQDAVHDLAATHSLGTWYRKLKTERFALNGFYDYKPNWTFKGEAGLTSISDGNSRVDFRIDGMYHLTKNIDVGGRYETVQAERYDSLYWSPSNYEAISGLLSFNGVSGKLNYYFIGGLGKVLTYNNPIRLMTVRFQYRLNRLLRSELEYSNSLTTRADGYYKYTGLLFSIYASF